MSTAIVFTAPIPATMATDRWATVAAELANNPGQWAKIGTITRGSGLGRAAQTLAMMGVEACQRSNGDGTKSVWARYVGCQSPTDRPRGVDHYDRTFRPVVAPVCAPLVWEGGK